MTTEDFGRHVGERFKVIVKASLRGKCPAMFDQEAPPKTPLTHKNVTLNVVGGLDAKEFDKDFFYRYIAPTGEALAYACMNLDLSAFEPIRVTREEKSSEVEVEVFGWSGPSYAELAEATITEVARSLNERG